ncbi:nuclear transport factor 2 family protein [Pleomorphomonas oryzae]|uniref:nuclear transport factor 2 family protein n=1 Tax=Pleomorphomonas oryzae TaxID=261934 RepID=UPI00041C097F|nr:nuclear transport factor 2 family protein [Pleomorphomonas oryzae]
MDDSIAFLQDLYDRFNMRDIDGVLAALTDNVAWANGMEGGYVYGREAIRAYWTHQWAMIDPNVEPVGFERRDDGAIKVEVQQTVRDLQGKVLATNVIGHVFRLRDGKVAHFDIEA